MPEELTQLGISEDVFYDFICKVNFDLLEPFADTWKENAGASLTKSVLLASLNKGGAGAGNFVMPVPAKIVLGTVEKVTEAERAEARKKNWDDKAVQILKGYLDTCNTKIEELKAPFRLCYREVSLSPIDLATVEAKRKKAQAALAAVKVSDKLSEKDALREFSAAFNGKVGSIPAQVSDKVETKVEDATEKAREKASDAVPGGAIMKLSTNVPCVLFVPC